MSALVTISVEVLNIYSAQKSFQLRQGKSSFQPLSVSEKVSLNLEKKAFLEHFTAIFRILNGIIVKR